MTEITTDPCAWCGGEHVGVCPKVSAIEYQEDGQTVRAVHFFPPAVEATSGVPESDSIYRERLLRHVGEHSVNTAGIRVAGSAELDEYGIGYNLPREMVPR